MLNTITSPNRLFASVCAFSTNHIENAEVVVKVLKITTIKMPSYTDRCCSWQTGEKKEGKQLLLAKCKKELQTNNFKVI